MKNKLTIFVSFLLLALSVPSYGDLRCEALLARRGGKTVVDIEGFLRGRYISESLQKKIISNLDFKKNELEKGIQSESLELKKEDSKFNFTPKKEFKKAKAKLLKKLLNDTEELIETISEYNGEQSLSDEKAYMFTEAVRYAEQLKLVSVSKILNTSYLTVKSSEFYQKLFEGKISDYEKGKVTANKYSSGLLLQSLHKGLKLDPKKVLIYGRYRTHVKAAPVNVLKPMFLEYAPNYKTTNILRAQGFIPVLITDKTITTHQIPFTFDRNREHDLEHLTNSALEEFFLFLKSSGDKSKEKEFAVDVTNLMFDLERKYSKPVARSRFSELKKAIDRHNELGFSGYQDKSQKNMAALIKMIEGRKDEALLHFVLFMVTHEGPTVSITKEGYESLVEFFNGSEDINRDLVDHEFQKGRVLDMDDFFRGLQNLKPLVKDAINN